MTRGVNHDTLLTVGWLELRKGPQVLHVPDFSGRYYSVQFTDPSKNTNFAYVGKRTTGTDAGKFLISGPDWKGAVQRGMTPISSPNNSVVIIGRAFVESDSYLPTAYSLAKQIRLTSQGGWLPGQSTQLFNELTINALKGSPGRMVGKSETEQFVNW